MISIDIVAFLQTWKSPDVIGIVSSVAALLAGAATACYKSASDRLEKAPDGADLLKTAAHKRFRERLDRHVDFSHVRQIFYSMMGLFSAGTAAVAFRVLDKSVGTAALVGVLALPLFGIVGLIQSERYRRRSRHELQVVADDLRDLQRAAAQRAVVQGAITEIDAAIRSGSFPNENRPVTILELH